MGQKILIIRPDRAGDALKSLPAIRALVATNRWQVEVLASEFNASLYSFEPGIKCHSLPLHWEKWNQTELRYQTEKLLQKSFDVAALLPCDRDNHSDRLFHMVNADRKWSLWSTAGEVISHQHVEHDERENIASLISKAVGEALAIRSFSSAPILSEHDRSEAAAAFEDKKTGTRYVLCPFASMKKRSLSHRNVVHLIRQLADRPSVDSIILPGISSDYEKFEKLRREANVGDKLQTIYPSSFRSLAAYLERCTGLVGVDSGPLHLAIAIDLPVLGFLGGCDKARWYPIENHATKYVHRGLLGRFPTRLGLQWHLSQWLKQRPNQNRIPLSLQGPVPVLF